MLQINSLTTKHITSSGTVWQCSGLTNPSRPCDGTYCAVRTRRRRGRFGHSLWHGRCVVPPFLKRCTWTHHSSLSNSRSPLLRAGSRRDHIQCKSSAFNDAFIPVIQDTHTTIAPRILSSIYTQCTYITTAPSPAVGPSATPHSPSSPPPTLRPEAPSPRHAPGSHTRPHPKASSAHPQRRLRRW